MGRSKKNNGIVLSNKTFEDFVWMSYRYCIGRKTIAAAHHAETIRSLIVKNPDCMSEERKLFMAKDIRTMINDHVRWRSNVSVEGGWNSDLYSMILYEGSKTPDKKLKYNINTYNNTFTTEEYNEKDYVAFDDGFIDYINWIRLANILDTSLHRKVYTNFNGDEKEFICYPYPVKMNDGSYKEMWTSPEKDLILTSYIAEEYIVKIE